MSSHLCWGLIVGVLRNLWFRQYSSRTHRVWIIPSRGPPPAAVALSAPAFLFWPTLVNHLKTKCLKQTNITHIVVDNLCISFVCVWAAVVRVNYKGPRTGRYFDSRADRKLQALCSTKQIGSDPGTRQTGRERRIMGSSRGQAQNKNIYYKLLPWKHHCEDTVTGAEWRRQFVCGDQPSRLARTPDTAR